MTEYFTREEAQRFAERYGLPEGLGKPNWHHILNEVFNAKLAALDSSYNSSYRAAVAKELTAAREYLEDLKETP